MSTPHADKHFWHTLKHIICQSKIVNFFAETKSIEFTYDLDEHLQGMPEHMEEWIEGNNTSAPWQKSFYTASKVLSVMFWIFVFTQISWREIQTNVKH